MGSAVCHQAQTANDPFVRKMLGDESPEELAHRLVGGTRLEDPKVREDLYDDGQSAIEASNDPLIRFAKSLMGILLLNGKNTSEASSARCLNSYIADRCDRMAHGLLGP